MQSEAKKHHFQRCKFEASFRDINLFIFSFHQGLGSRPSFWKTQIRIWTPGPKTNINWKLPSWSNILIWICLKGHLTIFFFFIYMWCSPTSTIYNLGWSLVWSPNLSRYSHLNMYILYLYIYAWSISKRSQLLTQKLNRFRPLMIKLEATYKTKQKLVNSPFTGRIQSVSDCIPNFGLHHGTHVQLY